MNNDVTKGPEVMEIQLGEKKIKYGGAPYLIAEIGVNHGGSMSKAKELIDLAKQGGADAAKFQTYKAGTLASKHSPSYWDTSKEATKSQYELFKKYDHFDKEDYIELAEYCRQVGIDFLSTPFDDEAVEFLSPLMPFFKIASADITNIPFLRKIASHGKPVVLSTGASNITEIERAVSELVAHGIAREKICLLHCVLNYPTPEENAHLDMILGLQDKFPDMVIGYSDHTLPDSSMLNLTAAYLKGAMVIEKHFTYDKTLPGNDHYHAMDMQDCQVFTRNIKKLLVASGQRDKAPLSDEEISRNNARRSIVAKRNIAKGEVLDESMLTYKRPQHGLSPEYWDEVIGKPVAKAIAEDELLTWDHIEVEAEVKC